MLPTPLCCCPGDTGCAHPSAPCGDAIGVTVTLGFLSALSETWGNKKENFRVLAVLERLGERWAGRGSAQRHQVWVCGTGRAPTGLGADPPDRNGEKQLSGQKMGCKKGGNDHQLSDHVAQEGAKGCCAPTARSARGRPGLQPFHGPGGLAASPRQRHREPDNKQGPGMNNGILLFFFFILKKMRLTS